MTMISTSAGIEEERRLGNADAQEGVEQAP
jgi:hypothetical protein